MFEDLAPCVFWDHAPCFCDMKFSATCTIYVIVKKEASKIVYKKMLTLFAQLVTSKCMQKSLVCSIETHKI